MLSILLAIHTVLSLVLIVLILVQRGKGAEIGAAFGSGASQTVFGAQGAASFLTRTTAILAALFFVSSLGLAYLYGQAAEQRSVTELMPGISMPAGGEDGAPVDNTGTGAVDVPALPVTPAEPAGNAEN